MSWLNPWTENKMLKRRLKEAGKLFEQERAKSRTLALADREPQPGSRAESSFSQDSHHAPA